MEAPKEYHKEKLTIDLAKANIFAVLIIIPILVVYGIPYYLIWKDKFGLAELKNQFGDFSGRSVIPGGLILVLTLIMGIIIHELIHGLTWSIFADRGFRSIRFGVLWKMLTPYCHCKEPLKVKHYIIGGLMPLVVLGLVPAIISIATGNLPLLLFGTFFTIAAGGDILIVNLLKAEDMENLVEDHPSEAGCYIYRRIESPVNPVEK